MDIKYTSSLVPVFTSLIAILVLFACSAPEESRESHLPVSISQNIQEDGGGPYVLTKIRLREDVKFVGPGVGHISDSMPVPVGLYVKIEHNGNLMTENEIAGNGFWSFAFLSSDEIRDESSPVNQSEWEVKTYFSNLLFGLENRDYILKNINTSDCKITINQNFGLESRKRKELSMHLTITTVAFGGDWPGARVEGGQGRTP